MIGVDCNVLVQLAIGDHPANARTLAVVESQAEQGEKLVLPSLVATEFLHVVTDERRFAPPLTMPEALDWIQEFLASPAVTLLEPTQASMDQAIRWMRQFNLGRKRILDTHLAAILHTSGVRRLLKPNPADFAVFGVLETLTP